MTMSDEVRSDLDSQQIIPIMSAEYFNLQSARSATIAEANGRTGLFLSSVSSGLVALAFVGQSSNMGQGFLVFGLVILPALFFLGLVTFVRVLETSIEDLVYLRGMIRIRHYFAETAPQIAHYFVLSIHDDWKGMSQNFGIVLPAGLQLLLTSAGMVSVINSILAAVFAVMILATFTSLANVIYAAIGVIVFVGVLVAHTQYQNGLRRRHSGDIKTLFPSPPKGSDSTDAR